MDDDTLFEVPESAYVVPPPPEELTRGERRKRLIAKRIGLGQHPLGKPVYINAKTEVVLGFGGDIRRIVGPTCGTCRFRVTTSHHDKTYPKCWYPNTESYPHPRDTGCESSDIRAWWPACQQYEEKQR